jgi:DNA-binding IclR family transcriptional regulator
MAGQTTRSSRASESTAKGIQSIEIGFRLVRALADAGVPLQLKEIASRAEMSASKARMYLVSLLRTQLIAQEEGSGLYRLGPFAAKLGAVAVQEADLLRATEAAMEELTSSLGVLMLLATWGHGGATLVRQVVGQEMLPIDFRVGGNVSLTRTATGHVFLSYLPSETTAEFRASELDTNRRTADLKFIDDAYLKQAVEAVRSVGCALIEDVRLASGVVLVGYTAVAVPIFDEEKKLRFVLTALHPKRGAAVTLAGLKSAVRELSERLSGGSLRAQIAEKVGRQATAPARTQK